MIRLFGIPKIVSGLFYKVTWRVPSNQKVIYLTFDDGPTPETTEWILAELKKFNAKASFFCVGENARRYPELLSQLKERGHAIGNHTHNHLNGIKTDTEQYMKNVAKCAEVIDSRLFRPPYGRITPPQVREIINRNFKIIMWSVLSYDYDNNITPDKIFKRITRQTRPGNIVVFHDNKKAMQNLKAVLPQYLEYCKQRGYRFKAL